MKAIGLLFVIGTFTSYLVDGHIRLTYPKARQYDFDFLTNLTTKSPCGMPENAMKTTFKTKLITGSNVDVTWHMALSDCGDFKIQLLFLNGSIAYELAPNSNANSNPAKNISIVQNYTISLPKDFSCQHCIIRLIHYGADRNFYPSPYSVWSCADVEIAKFSCHELNCYNDGIINHHCTNNLPLCFCTNNTATGERCQYQYECQNEADCNNNGRCLIINQNYNYPLKQCYCLPGFYGYKCSKVSSLTVAMPDDVSKHTYSELDSNSRIWYKIIRQSNEIEVIHQAKTMSWLGLGWRPRELKQSCQLFPAGAAQGLLISPINSQPNSQTDKRVNHSMDCMDMVIGSARGNLFRLFDYYSRDRSSPREDSFYQGSDSLTAAVGIEINGITTLRWRRNLVANESSDHNITNSIMDIIYAYDAKLPQSLQFPSGSQSSPRQDNYYDLDELKYHGMTNRGRLSLNFFDDARLHTSACSGSWSTQCGSGECLNQLTWQIYGDGTIHFEMASKTNKWIALGISHDKKMNASDAIVGWYAYNKPTITDRYIINTIPIIDIQDNVYLINGSQINGITTLGFARNLTTTDRISDISLQGCHYFFYGVGGDFDPGTKIISKHPTIPHITSRKICINGSQCLQHKAPKFEKLTLKACSGQWRTGCFNGDCQSRVNWNVYNDGTIHFQMKSKTDKWVALGFSYQEKMPNTDAIVGWYYNSTPTLMDSFIDGYKTPKVDAINDAYLINSSNINGEVTFNFYRHIITGDSQGDTILFGCNHFFLAVGGDFNPDTGILSKHPLKPSITSEIICIFPSICSDDIPPDVGARKDSLVFDNCSGSWITGCDIGICQNQLNWKVYKDGRIEITMASRTDRWIAMGISDDRHMNNSDAIVASFLNDAPTIYDRYLTVNTSNHYAQMDSQYNQNVFLISSSIIDGRATFRFYRNVTTNDTETDISLEGCHYFFFGIGGVFRPGGEITKHWSTPFISSQKICITSSQCLDSPHVNAAHRPDYGNYKLITLIVAALVVLL
ncbi:uncharacterized protein TRIADDRAFT_60676 [Trichoplax adhaerens]|uniref:EGF-like domain-containing protein n=1 Tax=Trichoplax adhaerens TaxID=10228 RepID=B3S929_TRIAD|nr:hypothetical protein TRIADDRAFT_60676 [Trichoplax adhaerens]EDV20800.1 hypothetical protein TRIADDRAFT_60676 [Trichoplax adhaerens]|eukprot:XP_002116741.1 hypothetical protein TRIADDRAFT_60676 [Trichoplax adhaerens]